MFVDVPKGDVIHTGVAQQALAQNNLVPQHDHAFTAIGGPIHTGMGGDDKREGGVGLVEQALHLLANQVMDGAVYVAEAETHGFVAGHQHTARNPRDGQDLDRQAKLFGRPQLNAVGHKHMGHLQGAKFFEGMGAVGGTADIVVAHKEQGGNACLGKAHNALLPFALIGGLGVAVFVGIARKDDQIHFFGDGRFHNFIQRLQKVENAQGQPRGGVESAVVGHINVGIGKVEEAHGREGESKRRGADWSSKYTMSKEQ